MLYSMTGFGRDEFQLGEFQCVIEVRSLNGKQFEMSTRIPPILKLYEIEIRNFIQKKLQRGSVDVNIYLKQNGSTKPMTINIELAKYYYQSILQIADNLNLEKKDILSSILRMPEIVSSVNDTIDEKLWLEISLKIEKVCEELNMQRIKEGAMLTHHILQNVEKIKTLCSEIEPFEKNRIEKTRERLNLAISDFIQNGKVDQNRVEQEIIFYIEKLDINEEKNRLLHHCEYFSEVLHEDAVTKGKRLSFIIQEMGREINTLGSKANDANIQKIVVNMKDELEQAKEQLLNAL